MADSTKWTDIPEADFTASQATEKPSVIEAKNRPPNPSRFRFERVNEVTWKLTNGELTDVPASHGQWGGYRTTKALAWVTCVGPSAWLARCKDRCCGLSPLKAAKAAAMAMAKGAAGDHRIANPVKHLNWLAAQLLDQVGAARE
jgi:hypothetical protein